MSKVTAILAIVFGSLMIIMGVMFVIFGFVGSYNWRHLGWEGGMVVGEYYHVIAWILASVGFVIVILSTVKVILAAVLLKRIGQGNTNVDGLVIGIMVLSFFAGSWITAVFAIIALCSQNENSAVAPQPARSERSRLQSNDFDAKVARLKQYKEDGIIDEKVCSERLKELLRQRVEEAK